MDSEYLRSLDIGLQEVGGKRPLNGVGKCHGLTNTQRNKQTDIWTFQLIESISPEGRYFENELVIILKNLSFKC